MDTHFSQKRYKCKICSNTYTNKYHLKEHEKTHGDKTKLCPKCDKLFPTIKRLTKHMKMVHSFSGNSKIHKCQECDFSTYRRASLTKHVHFVHEKPGHNYKCSYPGCSKAYIRANHLRRHVETHKNGNKFKCSDCSYSCNDPYNLKKHQLHMHTPGTSVNCGICGKTLKNHLSLPKHMKIHQDKKETCATCQKMFRTKGEVKKHSVVHTKEKRFKCEICGALFGLSDNLWHHKKMVHDSKPKLWQCTKCDMSFFYRCYLKRHEEEKHPKDPEQSKVQCGNCLKMVKNKYVLPSHMKRCQKVKNHKCDQCGRCFVTAAELRLHNVIHTAEKAFTCPYCKTTFSKIGNLRVHIYEKIS